MNYAALLLLFLAGCSALAVKDIPHPQERITPDRIYFQGNDVCIKNVQTDVKYSFTNTKSMLPTLSDSAHGIFIPVKTGDVHVGDIISYNVGSVVRTHRVVKLGADASGWYAITAADNTGLLQVKDDPEPARAENLNGVLAIVTY